MKNLYALLVTLLMSFIVNAQIIENLGPEFKNILVNVNCVAPVWGSVGTSDVDTNNDGEISIVEAEAVVHLVIGQWDVIDATGIEYFVNLESLNCEYSLLSSLDISALVNLVNLNCANNQLTSLDVSNLDNLEYILCSDNALTDINLNGATNLNHITSYGNNFEQLDFSSNPNINSFAIGVNSALNSINLKNGQVIEYSPIDFEIFSTPNLNYICVDNGETENAQSLFGLNININSYCNFILGGDYYSIEGNTKLDLDVNGCDTNDVIFPNLNFSITDETETGNFISNSSGNYSIPVGDGTHTITPVLENQNYFTITPSSLVVDFPTEASPFIQDFCITPNGTHDDLEITLIPLEDARPGFDTNYKIVYKNKGTTIASGNIDLTFQDELMDFVSASPLENSQVTNLLSWNFTDVTPFETREIDVTMNLNTPSETPPLNGDDILVFTATLNTSETDETPEDNSFTLNHTVVNSYDPNDKTCLEGDFITPERIGQYVHYMIRFENTGTANAINVVVKDHIDTSKYDLSTLVPLHASHDFVARIKDNSQDHYVEFIFEDINLPFDDANNDGYVAFKIKTLTTLVLGDTFENEAEIYFDFNSPIITDSAQTTVATLSTEEFELANNAILLYPNPTTHILYLDSKHAIKHIVIYDVSGRVIKEIAVIGSKTELNISTENLTAGTYFIKIKTAQGDTIKKLIKD